MSHAARQRLYRARQRAGLTVYRVRADDELLLALIRSGRITEAEALDREIVAARAAEVLREWSARWSENNP